MIYSREGTTQGDPLAMASFAIAVRPWIDRLMTRTAQATQIWFADDAASGGKLQAERRWWDALLRLGPLFSYHVNVLKSWLLVEPENLQEATTIFADTGLKITTDGIWYLGAPLSDPSFRESFVTEKVLNWKNELHHLAEIATAQPHLAFCALMQGLERRMDLFVPYYGEHRRVAEIPGGGDTKYHHTATDWSPFTRPHDAITSWPSCTTWWPRDQGPVGKMCRTAPNVAGGYKTSCATAP